MSLWNVILAILWVLWLFFLSRRKQWSFSVWQTNHLWRWHERASYCLVARTYTCRGGEYLLLKILIGLKRTGVSGMVLAGFSELNAAPRERCHSCSLLQICICSVCDWHFCEHQAVWSFCLPALFKPFSLLDHSIFSALPVWTNWSVKTCR